MNKNDKKAHRTQKGLVDPNQIQEFVISHETSLLSFLFEKLAPQSKKNIKRILANHQVSVGGAPVTQFDFALYPEDVVVVSRNRIAKHRRFDLPIICEDEDILALDKPSGLLSTATDREKGRTAYRLVSDYVTQEDPRSRIFVVHRLDEDTSGVIVFAKNWEVREALQNNWADAVSNRAYYAIVEGLMPESEGELRDYLDQNKLQLVYVTENPNRGKLAITKYKVMATNNGYSLLDVHIETGRKNQIMVQLGHIGHYIIGDDKYGEPSNPLGRLGLHSYELDFVNPLNQKRYRIHSPIPQQFKDMFWERERAQRQDQGPAEAVKHAKRIEH